jgi:hypothetical protein
VPDVNHQPRTCGEQALAEQLHPLVIGNNGRQSALDEQVQDTLFRLLQADRDVGRPSPARAEQGNAGINSAGSENSDTGRLPVLTPPATAASQAAGQTGNTLGQFTIGERTVLTDHRRSLGIRETVAIDGTCQIVIFKQMFQKNLSLCLGLIFLHLMTLTTQQQKSRRGWFPVFITVFPVLFLLHVFF